MAKVRRAVGIAPLVDMARVIAAVAAFAPRHPLRVRSIATLRPEDAGRRRTLSAGSCRAAFYKSGDFQNNL